MTVVIALYVNLVFYVVHYRKRVTSKKPSRRREKSATPAKEQAEVKDEE